MRTWLPWRSNNGVITGVWRRSLHVTRFGAVLFHVCHFVVTRRLVTVLGRLSEHRHVGPGLRAEASCNKSAPRANEQGDRNQTYRRR